MDDVEFGLGNLKKEKKFDFLSIFNESDSESDNFSQLQDSPYGDSSISCNYYSEEEFMTDH